MKLTPILASMFLACSVYAQTPAQLATQVQALQRQVTSLQQQVVALQKSPVQQLAPFVAVNYNTENGVAGPHITFHGANVHIINGGGQTLVANGLGNLIIGYDEYPDTTFAPGDRAGSHNIVMGVGNKFTTWATSGFVNGYQNLIGQQEAVVLTGSRNTVSGHVSEFYGAQGVVISGSGSRVYDGYESVIVGGAGNDIEYIGDVILGGNANGAGGVYGTVLGGTNNGINHSTGNDQDLIVPSFNPTGDISRGISFPVLQ